MFFAFMNSELYKKIDKSNAHRASRDAIAQVILAQENLFPDLFKTALNTNDKNHHKACWIMELVLEKKLSYLINFLDIFCINLKTFDDESALRSISKVCMFLSKNHILTNLQEEQIIESCLDWLISDTVKVATKAYSIRTLHQLGKKHDWVYPQLQRILTDDYSKHSCAYKAVAREILKKIK